MESSRMMGLKAAKLEILRGKLRLTQEHFEIEQHPEQFFMINPPVAVIGNCLAHLLSLKKGLGDGAA